MARVVRCAPLPSETPAPTPSRHGPKSRDDHVGLTPSQPTMVHRYDRPARDTTAFALTLASPLICGVLGQLGPYRTLDADDLVAESFAKVLRAFSVVVGPSVPSALTCFTDHSQHGPPPQLQAGPPTVSIDRDKLTTKPRGENSLSRGPACPHTTQSPQKPSRNSPTPVAAGFCWHVPEW